MLLWAAKSIGLEVNFSILYPLNTQGWTIGIWALDTTLSQILQVVIDTIAQARPPSARQAFALKWGLFVDWCSSQREDPQEMSRQCCVFLLARKVGEKAVLLHFESVCLGHCGKSQCSRWKILGGKHDLMIVLV